ncbi:MAG: FMN reductase (NAD(P)H) [Bacteroidetes bacterium ADurb.Bin408]|nr:MAG: FMN reductase (NAD(P)H) [Bacteroidetes bacterium ADurb.Bin408]
MNKSIIIFAQKSKITPMNTCDTLLKHRSIRQYKSDAIADDILEKILIAASRGATTGNMQLYSIIVTRDEARRKVLCPLHFGQKMVEQAPVILTFCADLNRFHQWCEARNAEKIYDNFLWFYNGTIDAVIAAQNAVLAAEDLGLGTCYLGTTTYMAPQIIEFFNLPQGVVPVTTVVLGYPAENPPLTDRLPLEAVVHDETYTDYTSETIDKLYSEKESLPLTAELVKTNQVENLAQVFTLKRYKKQDNIHTSNIFLDTIKNQGFFHS